VKILYTYGGTRDTALEHAILDDLAARFGAVTQAASHSGEDGMTTVTLDSALESAAEVTLVKALRHRPEVIDAARDSFGEGA
jgi:hypothetical protein